MDLRTLEKDALEGRYEKAKFLLLKFTNQKKDYEYILEEIEKQKKNYEYILEEVEMQIHLFLSDIKEMEEIFEERHY